MIAFSGGRTSAYLLWRCLQEGLDPDTYVLFANTGKEREETLIFVQACAERWRVRVHWLEYDPQAESHSVQDVHGRPRAVAFHIREMCFDTASRCGEPFADLIQTRRYLPNPVARFCTQELKIRVMRDFMLARGFRSWLNVLGIRADEPRRAARAAGSAQGQRWENALPLVEAGITQTDVERFWTQQPFQLGLKPYEGNCDLCFLKGLAKRTQIIRERPESALWWIEQEMRTQATFRNAQPSYARLLGQVALQHAQEPADVETSLSDCFCGD